MAIGEVCLLNECMPYLAHFIHENTYRFSPSYIPGDSILERSTFTQSIPLDGSNSFIAPSTPVGASCCTASAKAVIAVPALQKELY